MPRRSSSDLDAVSLAIGELRTKADFAADGQATIIRMLEEDRRAAATYRTDIRQEVRGLHTKVDPVVTELARIAPIVDKLEDLRIETRGERRGTHRAIGWLVRLAILVAGAAGYKGAESWLSKLLH